jgi:hypothetical protein
MLNRSCRCARRKFHVSVTLTSDLEMTNDLEIGWWELEAGVVIIFSVLSEQGASSDTISKIF